MLLVSRSALTSNYETLRSLHPNAEIGAVVKANAYGLGIETAVPILVQAGCETFFVNALEEGLKVRKYAPDALIYVFDGLMPWEDSDIYEKYRLTPVFSSTETLGRFPEKKNIALRADIGFGLAGMPYDDLEKAKNRSVSLLIAHLSCAEEKNSPENERQLALFRKMAALFPTAKKSLSASFGAALGTEYAFDIIRAGAFLVGSSPLPNVKNVAALKAKVGHVRLFQKGASLGYNNQTILEKETLVASILAGHGDGIPHKKGCFVVYKGRKLPVLGVPTTNYLPVDASSCPDIKAGDEVDLFGDSYTPDMLAADAGKSVGADILIGLNPAIIKALI